MPLTSMPDASATYAIDGPKWLMLDVDSGKVIPVSASMDLLQKLGQPPTFENHAAWLLAKASERFDEGRFEDDASIRLNLDDLR